MKLKMKHIGAIPESEISFDGLTVIAGKNGTGKSTVLKTLYSIIEASTELKQKITDDALNTIANLAYQVGMEEEPLPWLKASTGNLDSEALKRILEEVERRTEKKKGISQDHLRAISMIKKYLDDPNDIKDFFRQFVSRNILYEFDGQFRDIRADDESYAVVEFGDRELKVCVEKVNNSKVLGDIPTMFSSVIYMDTPYVIDEINARFLPRRGNHRASLQRKLRTDNHGDIFEAIIAEENKERLDGLISTVVEGTFKIDNGRLLYSSSGCQNLSALNLAAGLKTFSIIKLLSDNGYIGSRTLLLIDEPEVHLHPEWQMIFAELLILMSKEIGVKIVLTTHSPQFLLSIQAYSGKYSMHVDYYNFVKDESGQIVVSNVNGRVEEIYRPMAEAYNRVDQIYEDTAENRE